MHRWAIPFVALLIVAASAEIAVARDGCGRGFFWDGSRCAPMGRYYRDYRYRKYAYGKGYYAGVTEARVTEALPLAGTVGSASPIEATEKAEASELTAECPKKIAHNMNDPCGARCLDLARVL